ncbi:DUF4177 domain-containing protein [Maritimibacter sp. DP1N21-5]|uniref:DUF4177 domain-containing protein n=1 Tax=Maritimibacter sp. DP1N21-5 TaxID=2836867 RepID=UPI0021058EDD|nr:DUF4177 domain-containing protein [Maritimibacter sp. DP1N21-5]
MQRYEYRVVPAPRKGKKARGVKTAEGRFATALTDCMNEMAAEGWEYLRTDTLPSEERTGITGRTTVFQNMLVFRRDADAKVESDGFGVAPAITVDENADHRAPLLPAASVANAVPSTMTALVADRKDNAKAPDANAPDATTSDIKKSDGTDEKTAHAAE